jgi:hypothetical protein
MLPNLLTDPSFAIAFTSCLVPVAKISSAAIFFVT